MKFICFYMKSIGYLRMLMKLFAQVLMKLINWYGGRLLAQSLRGNNLYLKLNKYKQIR